MPITLGDPPQPAVEPADSEQDNVLASGDGAPGRSCTHCGSPLAGDQDWCLKCGAGAPGSLRTPRWRSTGAIAAGVAVLALGAAAAAIAALSQQPPKRLVVTKAVALSAPPTPVPTTPPKSSLPATPGKAGKLPIAPLKTKLPKIPLTAPKASKPASKTTPSSKSGTTTTGSSNKETSGAEGSGAEATGPEALLLDTNAAGTYNPYDLPASYFGDPSLTIDGDTATAWTAQVDPTTGPKMVEGVLLDLKKRTQLGALELNSQTRGMTVQVYGSTAVQAPDTIVSPNWTALSAQLVLAKRATHIKLRHPKHGFRYVLVWISKAPTADVGTPQAPGHVAVNEVELFPPS